MVNVRDRVTIMLVFDQIVTEEQVAMAWQVKEKMEQEGIREPLWRVLTAFPDVDSEMVFAEAARVYGFEEARVSRRKAVQEIQRARQQLTPDVWEHLVELRLFPIADVEQLHRGRMRTVYATHDPTRHEVQAQLRELESTGYELRYCPEAQLLDLLVEAFPQNDHYHNMRAGAPKLPGKLNDYLSAALAVREEHVFTDGGGVEVRSVKPLGEQERSNLINLFEDVLVEAVQNRASDICLLPNAEGKIEIYLQVRKQLKRWKVVEAADANTLLTLIKRDIVRFDNDRRDQTQKRLIQRWINDELIRFRVAALPASQDLHSESIVIRVLR